MTTANRLSSSMTTEITEKSASLRRFHAFSTVAMVNFTEESMLICITFGSKSVPISDMYAKNATQKSYKDTKLLMTAW